MKKVTIIVLISILFGFYGCGDSSDSKTNIEPPNLDLHAAIYMRDMDAIRQHIKAGTDLNIPEPHLGSSPLITCAALNEPEAAKILIKAGADLNKKNNEGSSALITAIVFDHEEVAKLLIESGADLSDKNNEGSTPLHTAAFFCRESVVQSLLDKGADKTAKNNSGKTPLQIVSSPFEDVRGIYNVIENSLKSMKFEFDYERIEKTRPVIAAMLK